MFPFATLTELSRKVVDLGRACFWLKLLVGRTRVFEDGKRTSGPCQVEVHQLLENVVAPPEAGMGPKLVTEKKGMSDSGEAVCDSNAGLLAVRRPRLRLFGEEAVVLPQILSNLKERISKTAVSVVSEAPV
ncbi:MAG: hypothetical protein RL885_03440 [Planctomycetota bacterium]